MNRREFTKSLAMLASASLIRARTTLWRPSRQTFNVKDFGALGNGVTDDTTAFERALLRASAKGGTVIVPAGEFPVNRSLHLRRGDTLQGLGEASVIDRR